MSFIFTGVCISKALLMLRHIGILMMKPRAYFRHQSEILFPAILQHWEQYQATLYDDARKLTNAVWSGDGRYDSMGHSAKYGTYTLFSNTMSKLVHFELLQVNIQSQSALNILYL